jgi:tetratricopeptide repeat protein
MERPPQAEKPVSLPPSDRPSPKAAPPPVPPLAAGGDVFDLGAPAPPPRVGGDVFELDASPSRAVAALPRQDEPFADLWAPPPAPAPAAAVAAVTTATAVAPEPEEEPEPEGVLFPGLASRESRRRYLESLAAEGLFLLDLTAAAQPAAPEAQPAAPPRPIEPRLQEPFGEPILARAASPEPVEKIPIQEPIAEPWAPEPAWEEPLPVLPPEEEPWVPEPIAEAEVPVEAAAAPVFVETPYPPAMEAPAPVAAEPAATVTLGELYLKQGHLAEAERIFQEILRRDPNHPAAREGLAQLAARRQERRPLEARELLAGYEPGAESGPAETAARKTFLLNSYLKRLRRGSQRGVS